MCDYTLSRCALSLVVHSSEVVSKAIVSYEPAPPDCGDFKQEHVGVRSSRQTRRFDIGGGTDDDCLSLGVGDAAGLAGINSSGSGYS